jgi:hypothetical protein
MLTPPTDSLYKFMAVFGLALIVTSVLVADRSSRPFNDASTSFLVEETRIADKQIADANKNLELLKQQHFDPKKGVVPTNEQFKALEKATNGSTFNETRAELERTEPYIKAKREYEFAKDEYIKAANEFMALLIVGSLLSAFGFYFWYMKIQRFLDKRLSAASSKKSAHASTSA